MKHIYRYLVRYIYFIILIIIVNACKKKTEEVPQTELEKLPAATQTGANTFGALVNGKAFVPYSDALFGHTYQCNYIYTNGGYYFYVQGVIDQISSVTTMTLTTEALAISEGQTLKLEKHYENGKAAGLYELYKGTTVTTHETTSTITGQLYISKFDQAKKIVSGVFFFKAINQTTGDTVKVTDGRFDMQYTN